MRRDRIDNLTSLRFFAALSVFLSHVTPLGIEFSKFAWGVNLGWTVSFFYVLSGFVLSISREGRSFGPGGTGIFIAERFFRLWPLHLVCAAIAIVTLGISGGSSFTQFYLFLTLQHSWIPSYSTAFFINGVSWSISVEWFFYIIFPFLIIRRTRTILLVAMLWAVAVYGFMTFVSWNPGLVPFAPIPKQLMTPGVTQNSFFHLFPPVRIIEFLSGMLVYQLYRRVKIPDNLVLLAQIACMFLLLAYMVNYISILTIGLTWLPTIIGYNQGHYGMFPLFAVIVYVFAHQHGLFSRALSVRPLVYLGEISFSLYMIHQIVITNFIVNTDVKTTLGPATSVLLAFVLSIAASSLLFHAIEKPSLAFAKRRLNAGRTRSAPVATVPTI